MLSLPQPEATDSSSKAGLPIIPMGESKAVLSDMLPYFYPYLNEREFLHKQKKLSILSIFEALCFVDKYEMHQLVQAPLIAALQCDTYLLDMSIYRIDIMSQHEHIWRKRILLDYMHLVP